MGHEPDSLLRSEASSSDPVSDLVARLCELQALAEEAGMGGVAERAEQVRSLLSALYPPPDS